MSYMILSILYYALLFKLYSSDEQSEVYSGIQALNRKNVTDGEVKRTDMRWSSEDEKILSYPKGDKGKLAEISSIWSTHYKCKTRSMDRVTQSGQLASISLLVYEGGVALLPCLLCVSPEEQEMVNWEYATALENMTFVTLEYKETMVVDMEYNLTIYHVALVDAGVYRCRAGGTLSGLMVLEVHNNNDYDIVKAGSSRGPYTRSPQYMDQVKLRVFSEWSAWSECSRCGRVGWRRRYGPCYVATAHTTHRQITNKNTNSNGTEVDSATRRKIQRLFEAFPGGMACHSRYLPKCIEELPPVQNRRDEIMIALCKVPCPMSSAINLSPRRNVESLQPATPARDVIRVVPGSKVYIRCPGTILRDIPVSWRVGTWHVVARELVMSSDQGRAQYINAKGHLVITAIRYTDGNLYSCWQDEKLSGTVRLMVWQGDHLKWNCHIGLMTLIVGAALLLRIAIKLLRVRRRKLGAL